MGVLVKVVPLVVLVSVLVLSGPGPAAALVFGPPPPPAVTYHRPAPPIYFVRPPYRSRYWRWRHRHRHHHWDRRDYYDRDDRRYRHYDD
jgi:hypothetical protein